MTTGARSSMPELAVLLEAVPRLEHRGVRELAIGLRDARVRAVVEAAVHADRPVHAVDHAHAGAREATQPVDVVVEGVEEARTRACREAVLLDLEAAARELRFERAQELMSPAARRRGELVEEREVGASSARREPVELDPRSPGEPSTGSPRCPRGRNELH